MKRRWVIATVLLALTGIGFLGWRQYTYRQRLEGLRLADIGRFDQARPLLEQALARNGRDVEVLKQLALGTLTPEPATAETFLSEWCDTSPDDPEAHRLRMRLRHDQALKQRIDAERLRMLEQALDDGLRVLATRPREEEVVAEVIWLLLAMGRHDEALSRAQEAVNRTPENGWLRYLQARAHHGRGERARAEALLDGLLTAPQRFADGLLLRAILHREAGQPDRAVPLLREALTLDRAPRRECLYQLSLVLGATGQKDEARRILAELQLHDLETAVTRDGLPRTPAVRVQMAEAMLDAGRTEEARALLKGVLAENPDLESAVRLMERARQ